MRFLYFMGIVCSVLLLSQTATAISEPIQVAVAVSNESAPEHGWPHLESFYASVPHILQHAIFKEMGKLTRCRLVHQEAQIDERGRSLYQQRPDVDFFAHFVLKRADKIFRNRTLYFTDPQSAIRFGTEDTLPRETVSLPALSIAFEIRLIDPKDGDIIWSALEDSTILLPHRERYVYNPDKYPGYTHPEVIRDFIAPILMQRFRNPTALRMLQATERWYLSNPEGDGPTGERLIRAMVAGFLPKIDAQLPLYGSVISKLEPDKKKRPQYELSIGADQGIVLDLQLDVFRNGMPKTKIGKLKIVSVSPSKSVARLHKLERSMRKRGESIAVGDEVLSAKRPVYHTGRDIQ